MIMITLGLLTLSVLWMVYGCLAIAFPALQPGIVYTHVAMGIAAAFVVAYLLSIVIRKIRGEKTVGLIRCAIAYAIMLVFFFAVVISVNGYSFLRQYQTSYIIAFVVYTVFMAAMLIIPLIGHIKKWLSRRREKKYQKQTKKEQEYVRGA